MTVAAVLDDRGAQRGSDAALPRKLFGRQRGAPFLPRAVTHESRFTGDFG